jgi:hypothetical protein
MNFLNTDEICWHLDASEATSYHNVDRDPENKTNDITFSLSSSSSSSSALADELVLNSLEIPLSQLLIEPTHNKIYFNEGIELILLDSDRRYSTRSNESDILRLSMTIEWMEQTQPGEPEIKQQRLDVFIPPRYNPIVNIEPIGIDYGNDSFKIWRFHTRHVHNLEIRDIWHTLQTQWTPDGSEIGALELAGLKLSYGNFAYILDLNVFNYNLMIDSPTSFVLDMSQPVNFDMSTTNAPWPRRVFVPPDFDPQLPLGHLVSPIYQTPLHLCIVLNRLLQQADVEKRIWGKFYYDQSRGRFAWRALQRHIKRVGITSPNNLNFWSLLGWQVGGCGDWIPLSPTEHNYAPEHQTFYTYIQIPVGNYDGPNFTRELNLQWNRFTFALAPGTMLPPLRLVVSDDLMNVHTITVAAGKYTAHQMAVFLAGPNFLQLQVEWRPETQKFVFQHRQNKIFGLEFPDSFPTDLYQRLGFQNFSYRGKSYYESDRSLYIPRKYGPQWPETYLINRELSFNYRAFWMNRENLLKIHVLPPMNFQARIDTSADSINDPLEYPSIFRATVGLLQTWDLIRTNQPGIPHLIIDQFGGNWADPTYSTLGTILINRVDPFVAEIYMPLVSNVYWVGLPGSHVLADIMGFALQDYSYQSSPVIWDSPYLANFQWPRYILISFELYKDGFDRYQKHQALPADDDSGSSSSYSSSSSSSHIVTKCTLPVFLGLRMDRRIPHRINSWLAQRISHIRVQILNPDHSLYLLHGRNWSLSVTLLHENQAIIRPETTFLSPNTTQTPMLSLSCQLHQDT